MSNESFTWNGQESASFGLYIAEQPSIIMASERATFTTVPARSGTVTQVEADDVYDDVILPVDCFVKDTSRLHDIGAWLHGAGKLALPERPGGYYEARVVNQIEFAKVLRGRANRELTISFRCHPFWYVSGAAAADIPLTASATFITNPGDLPSEPIITITGSGDISLMVGQQIVDLEGVVGSITLNTVIQEAYSGDDSQNDKMVGDFITIPPGPVPVSWSGNVTGVLITPNWKYRL